MDDQTHYTQKLWTWRWKIQQNKVVIIVLIDGVVFVVIVVDFSYYQTIACPLLVVTFGRIIHGLWINDSI